jgi:hypothetical protein
LVVASSNGCFPSSGFPNGLQPQLPASNSNSSQQLSPSSSICNKNCRLVLLIKSQHEPHRKRIFHYCSILLLPWKHAWLLFNPEDRGDIFLWNSRFYSSNVWCHNPEDCTFHRIYHPTVLLSY